MVIVADIIYLEARENNTIIHIRNGGQHVDSKRIGKFLELLDPNQFYKIHRSHAVNILEVSGYEKGRSGNVFLKNGKTLPVSVGEKPDFRKRMREK